MLNEEQISNQQILNEIRFGFLHPYIVAGMGEAWAVRIERTLNLLKEQGIRAILTLTEDDIYGKFYQTAGFLCHHEPIDDGRPPTEQGMNRAIAFIDSHVDKGEGVAVHCVEGRGRTGIVLAAWLGKKESLSSENAIRRIYELRSHTVLSPPQISFLHFYLSKQDQTMTRISEIK